MSTALPSAVTSVKQARYPGPKGIVVLVEPVTVVDDALVIPSRRLGKRVILPGVVDAQGSPVADATSYSGGQSIWTHWEDRSQLAPVDHLAGTWLYGGIAFPHFGHFLFESISRLWAVEALGDQITGLVFVGPRPWPLGGLSDALMRVLDALDVRLPIHFVKGPTSVERLCVPRQGSAMGPLAAGTPTFRAFVRDKLTRIAPREGVGKIYLTREAYALRRGGIFAETRLRELLEKSGYTAFAPERHSFVDQIATYRGASHIIGPDSSALHLVAYVAAPEARIAILLRRHDGARDLLPQLSGHLGRAPLVVNAITQIMSRSNEPNASWSLFADLDLRATYFALRQAGFIRGRPAWENLSDSDREALIASYETALKCTFKVIWSRGSAPVPDLPPDID
jgi:hypothetical protein